MPKISILTPVYNTGRYLPEMLESLILQSEQDWECVLVDDGSTDDSLCICQEYSSRDNRFVVIRREENSGSIAIVRNLAMSYAKSEFVCNIDSDDVVSPDYITKILHRQTETNADIVCTRLIYCSQDLSVTPDCLPMSGFDYHLVLSGVEAFSLTIGGWFISCAGMLCRKALYDNIQQSGEGTNYDEFISRQLLFSARSVSFTTSEYYYRRGYLSTSENLSYKLFTRLLVDRQLENFCVSNKLSDSVCRKAVSARFFSYVKLYYLFIKRRRRGFYASDVNKIRALLIDNFATLNVTLLKKYLPVHYFLFVPFGWRNFACSSFIWGSAKFKFQDDIC